MKLVVDKVAKSYLQGTTRLNILENLNLELNSGEIVAIVGESGSGKSTLLSLLAGLDQPDRGEIRWDGQSTSKWNEAQWAQFRKQSIGFVFQSFQLIPYLTALENAALPMRLLGQAGVNEKAQELLGLLGLGERLGHLPQALSGGENQRVAIARALIHQPRLILADEPTGSLDARTGHQVLEMFFGLLQTLKQTALIVTHSHEVASRCHRVLTLRQGALWST
jgi:putative ABC transport system ATP-binding protein